MISFLTRFRIAPRLAAAFGILLVGLIAIGAASYLNIGYLSGELLAIKDSRVPKVEHLVDMTDNANLISRDSRNLLLFDNLERQTAWIAGMRKAQAENSRLLALVKPEVRSEEGRKLVAGAEAAMQAFDKDLNEFLAHSQDGDISVAQSIMDTKLEKSQLAFTQLLDEIKTREIERIGVLADEAISTARLMRNIGLTVIAALIGAGLWLSWLISRSIVGPMQRALREANRIAEGDLSGNLRVRGRDEAAEMLKALMSMQAGLRDIVSDVREGVSSVASASQQIASGNQDLSGRTEEQASSLQQTAASIEQISGAVKNNAESADHANKLADSASAAASHGGDLVTLAVKRISELEGSSKRIAEIVGVIDSIAFQTNILALNAAVEAARAGEQGRGFAVVAGEVRNLAQRSAAAAKEIKQLISDSVEKVEGGSKLVEQAGATMEEIVTSVKRVTDIMAEITAASVEQSSGIDQVNQAVTQMDEVTQQNAALVEEAAAAAESLEEQSQTLIEAVSIFKLPGSGGSSSRTSSSRSIASSSTSAAKPSRKALPPRALSKGDDGDWEEF